MQPETWAEDDLTEDALLDGRVLLHQPRKGYRAATDPVLLAAAVSARPGDKVLDVGCGAGAASMCLTVRVSVEAHGLEAQAPYAALARRNAPNLTVWTGDLFAPPADLRNTGFDWVISNPPFFDTTDPASPDLRRDMARREAQGADAWAAACLRRVRSGGRIAIIHLAERLPDILAGLDGAGDVAVLPLQARIGRPAKRVIVTARKGAKGPFRLAPPLILHEGLSHMADRDDFTDAAKAVLRDAAPLVF
ncbi:MAG: tRNA1(Val) (adenine(37)-N6)-methyltransferase [Pikeienuella sp.]